MTLSIVVQSVCLLGIGWAVSAILSSMVEDYRTAEQQARHDAEFWEHEEDYY